MAPHPQLAEAFVNQFLNSTDWQDFGREKDWVIERTGPLTLLVRLQALSLPGVDPNFTLRLDCEPCPDLPPAARFVNPETGEYQPGTDGHHLPKLTSEDCRTHQNYQFPAGYPYGPQLVCSSVTYGYYVTNHQPTETQRWKPEQDEIGKTIWVIHRTLLDPQHYQGRF